MKKTNTKAKSAPAIEWIKGNRPGEWIWRTCAPALAGIRQTGRPSGAPNASRYAVA